MNVKSTAATVFLNNRISLHYSRYMSTEKARCFNCAYTITKTISQFSFLSEICVAINKMKPRLNSNSYKNGTQFVVKIFLLNSRRKIFASPKDSHHEQFYKYVVTGAQVNYSGRSGENIQNDKYTGPDAKNWSNYLDVGKKNGDDVIATALKVSEKALEEGRDGSQHHTVCPQVRILS
jgi:hypothetical protein